MRFLLFILSIVFVFSTFAQEKEQSLKNLFNEYHASVNHGIGKGSFGGGLGINHIFHPDYIVSLRTGLDFQFFHDFPYSSPPSHFGSPYDYYCSYVDLTIPVIMRINIKWVFIELGGNLAVGLGGQKKGILRDYNPQQMLEKTTKDSWNPGVSAGPVFGIGARIPLNEKLDLLIRPDVGSSMAFNQEFSNLYTRLCIGIHLK